MAKLLSEKQSFKWDEPASKAFKEVKEAIAKAPMLFHPNFKKDFIMYCHTSEHTMSGMLLQKNDKGEEMPISFMSIPLKKHELNYSLFEKQVFAIVKLVKSFRYYILHSHSIVYVSSTIVKSILTQ